MSRKSRLPQSPRHIMIFNEDWEFLSEFFGPYSPSRFGTGRAIQEHVHLWVTRLRQRQNDAIEEVEDMQRQVEVKDDV